MTTEAFPDEKRLFHLFRKCGMDEDEAFTALQEIRTMAGHNIIAKMEAQAVAQDAKAASQNEKLDAIRRELKIETMYIRWIIFIVALIATLVLAGVQLYSP